jgi:hypothetical protein
MHTRLPLAPLQVRGMLVRLAQRVNRRIYCHKGTGVWRNAKIERQVEESVSAILRFPGAPSQHFLAVLVLATFLAMRSSGQKEACEQIPPMSMRKD